MPLATITCSYFTHYTIPKIALGFIYNTQINNAFKKIPFVKYSSSQKTWYLPKDKNLLLQLIEETKTIASIDISQLKQTITEQATQVIANKKSIVTQKISVHNQAQLHLFIQTLLLKSYSPSTLKTYKNEFSVFLETLKNTKVESLSEQRIKDYLQYCYTTLQLSDNTIHSRINALKFYYEQVLYRENFFFAIPRPKKPLLLPNVLAINQVEKLFAKLENLKHKTMLYLAYSAGLRVSEVINLKLKDIHSERMVINIKGAKGKKDRTVILSEGILELLRKYYIAYQPNDWLFEGQNKCTPYSTRSLQQIFHRAKNASKIKQDVTFHSLRHSYATHLHERGTDIKLIQELLGHNDIKTTLRYTHVSKQSLESIQSPFDDLHLNKD